MIEVMKCRVSGGGNNQRQEKSESGSVMCMYHVPYTLSTLNVHMYVWWGLRGRNTRPRSSQMVYFI